MILIQYSSMYLLPTLNLALAVCGLALAAMTVALYVDYFLLKGKHFGEVVREFAWPLVMGVSIGSVALSLLYSEYFGFIPCSLCWLQRIAIYPQALMSVMAFKLRDHVYFPLYGIGLSVFGLAVAIYQYIEQMIPKEAVGNGVLPCLLDGSGADCADKVIDEFGFVTFPFLTAVTFAFLIVVYLYMRRTYRNGV